MLGELPAAFKTIAVAWAGSANKRTEDTRPFAGRSGRWQATDPIDPEVVFPFAGTSVFPADFAASTPS